MFKLFSLTLILFVLLFNAGCKPQNPPKYTETINVMQADSIIGAIPELILIDVRTPEEHEEGSIPNSLNIDVENDSFTQYVTQLDTLDTYLIYCRSGSRSLRAVEKMEAAGFKYLYNMDGGFMAWSEKEE